MTTAPRGRRRHRAETSPGPAQPPWRQVRRLLEPVRAVSDDQLKAMPMLAQQQTQTTDLPPFEQGGASYVANVVELEQMGQNRPRLVLVQSLAPTGATFSIFKWLLWLSPVLVLIGIALATGVSSNRAS